MLTTWSGNNNQKKLFYAEPSSCGHPDLPEMWSFPQSRTKAYFRKVVTLPFKKKFYAIGYPENHFLGNQ